MVQDQPPILDSQDQNAALGVKDNKVGVESGGANGNVEPAEIVVLQLRLQQSGKAALAGRIEFAGGYTGD